MNIKKLLGSCLLTILAISSLQASAGNINANAARSAAINFLHQQATKGSLRAHSATDIQLVHAEASSAVAGANDFYAFNLKGGGFVIISGEDRGAQVLGYSDQGYLDFNNLPYGMQRKLEIARAMATDPKLLLLDEPAAGMNPNETAELMDTIRLVRDRFDMTILLIEHDMRLVSGICERLTVLNFGRTLKQGPTAEVLNDPEVIKAYLGD
jgi:ATPase subunit of ABC transporter with duplicated ATPase domains